MFKVNMRAWLSQYLKQNLSLFLLNSTRKKPQRICWLFLAISKYYLFGDRIFKISYWNYDTQIHSNRFPCFYHNISHTETSKHFLKPFIYTMKLFCSFSWTAKKISELIISTTFSFLLIIYLFTKLVFISDLLIQTLNVQRTKQVLPIFLSTKITKQLFSIIMTIKTKKLDWMNHYYYFYCWYVWPLWFSTWGQTVASVSDLYFAFMIYIIILFVFIFGCYTFLLWIRM